MERFSLAPHGLTREHVKCLDAASELREMMGLAHSPTDVVRHTKTPGGRWPYLGMGFLFAACLTLVQQTSPVATYLGLTSHVSFLAGMFMGFVLCGLLFAIGGLGTRHADSRSGATPLSTPQFSVASPAVPGLVFAVLGLMLYYYDGLPAISLGRVATDLSGAAFGAGVVLLASGWIRAYSPLRPTELAVYGSASMIAASGLYVLSSVIPYGLLLYVCVVLELLASTMLLFCLPAAAAEETQTDESSERIPFWSQLGSIVNSSWPPLAGLLICAFLYAFVWRWGIGSGKIGGLAHFFQEGTFGPVAASLLVLAIAKWRPENKEIARFFDVSLPVIAAVFLIVPNFNAGIGPAWDEIARSAQDGGAWLITLATWSTLSALSHTSGVSERMLFGTAFTLLGTVSLLGLALFSHSGIAGSTVGVILFIVYLAGVTVSLILSGKDERAVRIKAQEVLDDYIRHRCQKLVRQHSLTPREAEILRYLGRGHSYAYVARDMYLSENTVRTHMRNIYRKLGVGSREELIELLDATVPD